MKGDVAMKKTVILVLCLALVACALLILPSCEDIESVSVDPMAEYTPNYEGLSEQEIKVRKIADEAIKEEFGFNNLANYQISVKRVTGESVGYRTNANKFTVGYTLQIGGIVTDERYSVTVEEYEVVDIYGDYGEFAEYLSLVSKEDVDKAVDELIEKFNGEITRDECYFHISDGKLTLWCEKIVSTPDGSGSCGDHKHVMHKVVVHE